ncbi:MAG: hypothetical protein M1544_00170 [Candidatus Marsarchaeota archaeon]|nr:hypothetical protein [Candidatus Marsarchaeota archaeon]MCL5101763.1 hypothetical protein [Candidatus Marsarchaeota archaeon]
MDARMAIRSASKYASTGMLITCPYCGSDTVSTMDHCVCSWCEALIHAKMSAPKPQQPKDSVRSLCDAKAYDKAVALCDAMYSNSKSPWLTYLKGIVLLSASNNETSLISYDKPGFMEENAEHRRNASKLYADARLALYKSVSDAGKISADSQALDTTFLQFMASAKLKDVTAAKHYLNDLSSMKSKMSTDYAKMVLFRDVGQYEKSLDHATYLMEKSNFSVCSLYYASLALLKLKKLSDAKFAINEAIKYISTPSAIALHSEIENFGKIED